MSVAEGGVPGKLRFCRRYQLFSAADIVCVRQSVPAALEEERAQYLAVHLNALFRLGHRAQRLRLQRIVAAQRGIAAAHEHIFLPRLARSSGRRARDIRVDAPGLFRRKAARVREYEEKPVLLPEAGEHALICPVGVDRDVVYCLNAGRVVVEHDELHAA